MTNSDYALEEPSTPPADLRNSSDPIIFNPDDIINIEPSTVNITEPSSSFNASLSEAPSTRLNEVLNTITQDHNNKFPDRSLAKDFIATSAASQLNISSNLPESFKLDLLNDLFDDSDRITVNDFGSNRLENIPLEHYHFLDSAEYPDLSHRQKNKVYGDQVLPDNFALSFSSVLSVSGDESHSHKDIRDSVAHLDHLNKPNKDRLLYHFVDDGSETPFNSPSSTSLLGASSPPPSRSQLPIERGLRLITSGSSIQGKILRKDEVERLNRRRKASIIHHSDFANLTEGDLLDLFSIKTAKVAENVEADEIKFKSEIESSEVKDDEADEPEIIPQEKVKAAPNFDKPLPTRKFEPVIYQYLDSERSSLDHTSEAYSAGSLMDVFANGFERNFPLSSGLFDENEHRAMQQLDKREDWIKSLDSAFDIDENLTDELRKTDEFLLNIEKNLPSTPSPITPEKTIELVKTVSESGNSDKEETFASPYSVGLFSSTTEKVTDFLQKISSRLVSPSSINLNNQSLEIGSTTLPITKQLVICSQSSPSDLETDQELIRGFLPNKTEDIRDSYKVDTSACLSNQQPKNSATGNTLNTTTEFLSAPGSLTAKLYVENGLSIPSEIQGHISEDNIPHFLEDNADSTQTTGIKIKSSTAEVTSGSLDKISLSNGWITNNRFVTPKKDGLTKRKTIRKILFSALSKDSTGATMEIDPNTRQSHENKERSGWSLLRSKTFSKRRISPNFSLDSGESLKGYAAEYADRNDLSLPKSSEFMSNEAEAARKIIESGKNSNTIDGIVSTFDDRPITKDSYVSNTDDTLGSFITEKLGIEFETVQKDGSLSPVEGPPVKHQNSLFFTISSIHQINGKTHHHLLKRSRTIAANDIIDSSKQSTIRFAPTPEYIPNTGLYGKSHLGTSRSRSSFNSSAFGSLKSVLKARRSREKEMAEDRKDQEPEEERTAETEDMGNDANEAGYEADEEEGSLKAVGKNKIVDGQKPIKRATSILRKFRSKLEHDQ